MGIIDKIKDIFDAGEPQPGTLPEERPEDSYLGTQLSTTGIAADLSTPVIDPALRGTDADGIQPVEVERERDPEARRDNEVVRKP